MHYILKKLYRFIRAKYREIKQSRIDRVTTRMCRRLKDSGKPRVFYFGVPRHPNLGDLAQYYCIRKMLARDFADYEIVEIPTLAYMHDHCGCRRTLKKIVKKTDLLLFQSGYCTSDLGGYEDLMHQRAMADFPENDAVALPQTVFFKTDERKRQAQEAYNRHGKKLLFFARDELSFSLAKELFPQNDVRLMPDVVTSLIGSRPYRSDRNGIIFCCRSDGEQYYSLPQIQELREQLASIDSTELMDTTLRRPCQEICADLDGFIEEIVGRFEKAKVVVTDRFHGNIFSLVANTPVIVLRTTDHKVTSGLKWFSEVYKNRVFFAKRLEDVKEIVEGIYKEYPSEALEPYFEARYFSDFGKIIRDWQGGHTDA